MRSKSVVTVFVFALAATIGGAFVHAAPPGGTVVYDAIPAVLPGNVPSLGPEAYSFRELGDKITLAAGSRTLLKVDLVLSSWACESGGWSTNNCVTATGATFTHSVKLNIYQADGVTAVGSVEQTFTIPYRPSPDSTNCTGTNAGKWWNETACFNGTATTVTFSGPGLSDITLPDTFVFGITYNTSNHGYKPISVLGTSDPEYKANAPYDSLNIGLVNTAALPTVGIDNSGLDGLYWDTSYAGFTCLGVALNTLKEDAAPGCWTQSGLSNGGVDIRFTTGVALPAVNLAGFYTPVDNAPMLNKAKAGQTVPLKFSVMNALGAPVTNLTSVNVTLASVTCGTLEVVGSDPIVDQSVTGNSGLQNLGNGYYQWNWKTSKGTTLGCYVASLSLPDTYATTPAQLRAYFEFKK